MDYKEETLNTYNKHPEYFSEYFKGLLDLEKRTEFKKFISLLKDKKILDLGCGSGDHALYFKEQGLDVTCIDNSKEMIKICKNKGLQAEIMDIENLEFKYNSFDGIWAVTSLLHIPKEKIPQVILNLKNLLKDNGAIHICLKEGEGEGMIIDKNDSSTKRFFAFWKKEEMLKMLDEHFELIDFEKIKQGNTIFLQFFLRKT